MDPCTTCPANFQEYQKRFPEMFDAYREAARRARTAGPLDEKTTHLVQLAAAVGIRSEGAVHSHARRALDAGAAPDELFHVVNLMVSTVGFPAAAAAFSWIRDVLENR
ncbi:carboxymuconolactone decarboxylase family protein [Dissulfurirhabdus thermomarina]|uniref:Carboxymuconolactone decarboxylase family protein n=1 Tax=Dissulfurirhabdus thermomarina TaxID=1765737 RepID=A0A6N9TS67_DISTH|nr:carboxymuconolactone decarboxylase family protein [Dissulfurirhabdus thermomarina]NDY42287.1 carboxymuconolactone decarboxylase family protein [Dissulfurirhabdus thermomarina]NMX23039.1 carboxymuconolactone decarboxylase family protein [Dissulfurirhabdus thermomarina]